ncbi:uncharacterized protein LOC106647287 [Copidosoma floridanum]|uniref:uncharacterized protein LOC106647287 n=1 Tax=Copidosoma floridanum TaxID=29053 RepID=UPI0006C9DDC8|nr:uncharacterized protein LOC106647287 [Copidosoma floridanum]
MSCFGGRDELLYLVELTVERLKLTADKYREDFAELPPLVKLKFLDFPVFEITPRRDADDTAHHPPVPPDEYDESEGLIYACGKSVLFVRKPRDLVSAMKAQPLKVGVFREGDTFPVAEASIPLSGCLCDQVTMVRNDPEHRPKPYELKGGYNILDSGKDFAGSINIYLRLTFFGSYIVSHYQMYEDSCVFRNDFDGEMRITKIDGKPENSGEEDEDVKRQFKITEGTVLASMRSESASDSLLTTPGKPSDEYAGRYRSACSSIASDKAKTNKSVCLCPSGCSSRGTVAYPVLRANDPRKGRGHTGIQRESTALQFMPTHCAVDTTTIATTTTTTATTIAKNDEQQLSKRRLRGGGGNGELAGGAAGLFSGDADFTWYNSRFALPLARLEGGGGSSAACQQQAYPAAGCGKPTTRSVGFQNGFDNSFVRLDSINPEYLSLNRCRLRHVENKGGAKPECSCTGNDNLENMLRKKGQPVCRKKPCMGPDCLIKAFQDAQEFVDSIGKVPGLAGLGITESPYFGRSQEPREIKKADSKAAPVNKQPEATSNLCNAQNVDNLKKANYSAMSGTLSTSGPKRSGVVQEGVTSLPDPSTHASLRSKKKDEKSEKPKEVEIALPQAVEETPCGEPKCKSRPKKVNAEKGESKDNAESTQKTSNASRSDKKSHSKGRSQSVPGEKSKKPIQFDYSYGSAYPTSVYGHKKCSLLRARVPAHMGWMWNQIDPVTKLKPRTGWRPGAISLALKGLLKEAREGFFKEVRRPMSLPRMGGKKGGKVQKTTSYTGAKKNLCEEAEAEEEIEHPPTLHVHRKDGTYYVTMYPIRQDASGSPRLDEPTNPLQFKIVKSKDSIASSSTASDMEIEFSPPAAVNRPRKRPNVVHLGTQVKQQEILDSFKRPSDSKKKHKDAPGKESGKKEKKK